MTVYDVATRCIIINEIKQADRSSRMDLLVNEDGSVDLHIGPDEPKRLIRRTGRKPQKALPPVRMEAL